MVKGRITRLQWNSDLLGEHILCQHVGEMVPVDEAEVVAARDETHTTVLDSRIVEQDLACDLEVAREEGPENGILMVAIRFGVWRLRKDLVVVELDVRPHQGLDDVDDFGASYKRIENRMVVRRQVEMTYRIQRVLNRRAICWGGYFPFRVDLSAASVMSASVRCGRFRGLSRSRSVVRDVAFRVVGDATERKVGVVVAQGLEFVRGQQFFDDDIAVLEKLVFLFFGQSHACLRLERFNRY